MSQDIPREIIKKRKSILEFLMSVHDTDTDFDKGVRACLREELCFIKAILGEEF